MFFFSTLEKSFLQGPKEKPSSPAKSTVQPEFGLSPLLQVEIFLGVMLTPGADIRVILTETTETAKSSYRLVLLDPRQA